MSDKQGINDLEKTHTNSVKEDSISYTESDNLPAVIAQIAEEQDHGIQYRTCSWQKVRYSTPKEYFCR